MPIVGGLLREMVVGTKRQKVSALLTLAGWFAMGAFVASTIEHHLNVVPGPEAAVAVGGGVVATIVAVLFKV